MVCSAPSTWSTPSRHFKHILGVMSFSSCPIILSCQFGHVRKGHVCLHWEWSSHAAAQSAALGGLGCPLPIRLYLPCALLSLRYRSTQTETLAMGLQPDLAPALAEGPQVTEQHEISPRALPTALALNPCMASGLWHLLPPALLR